MNYKIALIRGDGIGPEVVGEAVKVLEAVGKKFGHTFTYEDVLLGGCATDAVGKSYPDGTAEACKACDAVLLGAVGGPKWGHASNPEKRPETALLSIRKDLGLYANLRPAALRPAMRKLAAMMEKAEYVKITGPGTDISFSIKGLPAIPCAGECNLPDGEVFTAPVIDSANGHISFNTPSLFQGIPFDNIRLTLKNGLVVHAEAGDKTGELNAILDTDPGARRLGEFAFGVNPAITRPMRNILFDEKISGSFHLTPGQAYHVADNGNQSRIHWDMVCIQTEAAGGGDIYLDGKLVRRNGLFTLPELAILNPSLS